MLNNKERLVMGAIYEMCEGTNACLVRPVDILKNISYKKSFTQNDLRSIIDTLAVDDYFELIKSDDGGKIYYCINLKQKGEAFKRSITVMKRNIGFKILVAIGSAGVTFVAGLILRAIFKA